MSREPVLVVLADGIGYAGALIGDGDAPAVLLEAHAQAASLGAAIADLTRRLAGPGIGRVRRAVVMSWQVQCAMVALPVDPRHPLPEAQMREAVRWELEPFVAGARARRLGAILVGRGHLTPHDRDRLLAAAESPLAGMPAPRRLGEAAVAEGLVTPEQLATCLALQQEASDPDAGLACGWRPTGRTAADGRRLWLACAAPQPLLASAEAACSAAGLRLLGLLPAVGCAVPPGQGVQEVLDHQRGLLCRVRWEDGVPVDLRQSVLPGHDDPLPAAAAMIGADAARIWLAGRWAESSPDAFAARGRACAIHPAGPAAGLAWAARAMADPASTLPPVRGMAVAAAGWRHPERLAIAACAILAIAACACAGALTWQRHVLERRSAELGHDRREALAAEQADLSMQREAEALTRIIPERQARPSAWLGAIAAACPDSVRLNRIRLDDGIAIAGWSADAASAQAFRNELAARFRDLRTREPTQAVRRDPQGAGFVFELALEPGP